MLFWSHKKFVFHHGADYAILLLIKTQSLAEDHTVSMLKNPVKTLRLSDPHSQGGQSYVLPLWHFGLSSLVGAGT